jgi:3-isopropylmalate dehydrogenase
MFLSAAMMLEWLGDKHAIEGCSRAAAELTQAVERAFASGTLVPMECGGTAGTQEITERVLDELEADF